MGVGPVVGVTVGNGIIPLGAGTTRNGLSNVVGRLNPRWHTDVPLPQFNPSTVAPTPNQLSGHIFPVKPLPGGAGQAGPVGYPIDSG